MERERWPVVFVYSRADALANEVLVDVSTIAREAGIRHPTALTEAVWNEYVRVPDGVNDQVIGRLWDVLWMFRCAAQSRGQHESELLFELYVRNHNDRPPELVKLKAVCGPGDTTDPVITIMLPSED